jgi:hypothetical protein
MSLRSCVILVEPEAFFANPITMRDNVYQHADDAASKVAGLEELRKLDAQLRGAGVHVCRVLQPTVDQPDAIFPNNSFSLRHTPGRKSPFEFIAYPMSAGRRNEIPLALLRVAAYATGLITVLDLRHMQEDAALTAALSGAADEVPTNAEGLALEGTGALVFGRDGESVFMGRSQRGSDAVLRILLAGSSATFGSGGGSRTLKDVFLFDAVDDAGRPVYHTNVVGWSGRDIAAWNLDAMRFSVDTEADGTPIEWGSADSVRVHTTRRAFTEYHERHGVALLSLSHDEMNHFCGNCIELLGAAGPLLSLSSTAWANLAALTRETLLHHYGGDANILVADVPTIERLGGGSVRCLQAVFEVHDAAGDEAKKFLQILAGIDVGAALVQL